MEPPQLDDNGLLTAFDVELPEMRTAYNRGRANTDLFAKVSRNQPLAHRRYSSNEQAVTDFMFDSRRLSSTNSNKFRLTLRSQHLTETHQRTASRVPTNPVSPGLSPEPEYRKKKEMTVIRMSVAQSNRSSRSKTIKMLRNLPKTEEEFKAAIDKLSVYLSSEQPKKLSDLECDKETEQLLVGRKSSIGSQAFRAKKSLGDTAKTGRTSKQSPQSTKLALDGLLSRSPGRDSPTGDQPLFSLNSPMLSFEKRHKRGRKAFACLETQAGVGSRKASPPRRVPFEEQLVQLGQSRRPSIEFCLKLESSKGPSEALQSDAKPLQQLAQNSLKTSPLTFDRLEKVPNSRKEFAIKHHLYGPIKPAALKLDLGSQHSSSKSPSRLELADLGPLQHHSMIRELIDKLEVTGSELRREVCVASSKNGNSPLLPKRSAVNSSGIQLVRRPAHSKQAGTDAVFGTSLRKEKTDSHLKH